MVVVVLTLSGRDVPEQRVDDHRHDRRVQADLHREARDRGVRHGLGDDDGRGGQAGQNISAHRALHITSRGLPKAAYNLRPSNGARRELTGGSGNGS